MIWRVGTAKNQKITEVNEVCQQYKSVAQEREMVAFRIYLFLLQRNKINSKRISGICVISYKQC